MLLLRMWARYDSGWIFVYLLTILAGEVQTITSQILLGYLKWCFVMECPLHAVKDLHLHLGVSFQAMMHGHS